MTQYKDKVEAQRKKLEQEKLDNQVTSIDCRYACLLYTSPSPRDVEESRMPSSA